MTGPYQEEFLKAMRTEISELESHTCWDIVSAAKVPEGAKVIPTMWVFKIKHYPDGRIQKFKARLVVRGDFQVEGEDYDEKYAPVVPWSTVRLMLSIVASQGLVTRQVHFSNAFVQAHLKETKPIFFQTPPTFHSDVADKVVLRLNKSKSLRSCAGSAILGQSFARRIGEATWFPRESDVPVFIFSRRNGDSNLCR
jgi:histone deacetylase 1/2